MKPFSKLRSLLVEFFARRRGHRHNQDPIYRSARDIVGPTGWMWSSGWDEMARGSEAYIRSLNRPQPGPIYDIPIPVSERCLEDHISSEPFHPEELLDSSSNHP